MVAGERRSQRVNVTLADLVNDVGWTIHATPNVAIEQLDVVCGAIADAWRDEDRRAVTAALPADIASLFTPGESATAAFRGSGPATLAAPATASERVNR